MQQFKVYPEGIEIDPSVPVVEDPEAQKEETKTEEKTVAPVEELEKLTVTETKEE
jgi:hypothetical protein